MPPSDHSPLADIEASGGRLPEAAARQVRQRGCVVVRGMVPEAEVGRMRAELDGYLSDNSVNSAPGRSFKDVYWSTCQVQNIGLQ